MTFELIILLSMLSAFAIGIFLLKFPAGVSLAIAAVVGGLVAGEGLPIRHLIEGGFGFFDPIMIIATAMIFMKSVEATGALRTISYYMIKSLYRYPTLMMIFITYFVMFPGMLTGLASACILTTGALVVKPLKAMGMSNVVVGSLIVMASVFGEIAPPICIPVMIIGGGVDMPYIGFEGPLFLASFPLATIIAVFIRFRYLKPFNIDEVLANMDQPVFDVHGFKLYIPIFIVVTLLFAERIIPNIMPHLGVPLIFMLGTLTAFGTGEKVDIIKQSREAIRNAMPVMAILVGVGMFIQIMTLTGVRGYLAITALQMPDEIKYVAALIMPFFGSAYASASVVGVPLVFVFIHKNEIIVTSALALLAALGDTMPPPSLLCAYAAQMVGEKNHFKILKQSLGFIALSMLVALLIIVFADGIGGLISQY
jgi:TRAP-type C4-dicarboxylate transport system permease large subunit